MAIPSYREDLFADVQENLARMFDFAICQLQVEPGRFYDLFVESGYARRIAHGEPRACVGMSGTELARAVLDATGTPFAQAKPIFPDTLGPMYWAGWALADYQWRTGFSFEEIRTFAPFNRIVDLYPTFHETDISRFLMRMESWRHEAQPGTVLKRHREARQMTQRQLAEIAGVSIRLLQDYEQGRRDINSAEAATVTVLASALGCAVEDLLERRFNPRTRRMI